SFLGTNSVLHFGQRTCVKSILRNSFGGMEWRQDGHGVLSEARSFSGSVLLRRMAHSFKPLSEEGCRALPIADSAQDDYRFALPIAAHHIPDSDLRSRYAICQFSHNHRVIV